jgi:YD repeat-containing protein
MPVLKLQLNSKLSATEVLSVLTDFSSARSTVWPGVDDEHLKVHEQGPGWADVTEGNKTTWERERYSWDAAAGTVSATTTDSNVWASGSGWVYRLTPNGTGTRIDVTLTRHGKGVKGKLIGALLPVIGKSAVTKSLAGPLQAE